MNFLQKIPAEWPLRLGLGAMYLYSGIDMIRHPSAWYWALRPLPTGFYAYLTQFGLDRYFLLQGIGEIVLALILFAWFLPRYFLRLAALLTTIEMAAILLFIPIDAITFRDIGLLGAGASLSLLAMNRYGANERN